ncbi:putative replication protein [Zea mays]|uniref:Putative replication protein n=1 Tax=Zea mays TaxID=4577 RepID=A0A1D6M6H6_MAIZE|nr:putative replication protein [Zea mays]
MNPLDQPFASVSAHASRYAIPFHSQWVRRKRPGDKSLLDFPATLATANRQHRIQKMRRTLASTEQVSTDAASPPLERSYVELLKETYKVHSYYGGPSDECPHCGAVFWFQERVKSVSAVAQRRLVYNLCCRGGKIVLEPYKCPPSPLCDLLRFDGDNRARRLNEPNPFTCYGRLSNQLAVDAYSTIEASRLQFIADHQKELHFESIQGITDAIGKGLTSADSVGGRVIVPTSFTGGRRYHVMNYQDAMAIYRVYNPPDLFVTFTCNPKWKEIVDALRFEPGQQPCDRSDIVVRSSI